MFTYANITLLHDGNLAGSFSYYNIVSRSQTAFSSFIFGRENIKEEKAVWLREDVYTTTHNYSQSLLTCEISMHAGWGLSNSLITVTNNPNSLGPS